MRPADDRRIAREVFVSSKIGKWTQGSISAEPGSLRLSISMMEVVVLMMWTVTPVAEMEQRKVV